MKRKFSEVLGQYLDLRDELNDYSSEWKPIGSDTKMREELFVLKQELDNFFEKLEEV